MAGSVAADPWLDRAGPRLAESALVRL